MTDKIETETQTEDVSGLKANNADLRKSLREEKDKNRSLEDRLNKLEADAEDAKDTGKSELDKLQLKYDRDIDKLNKANTKLIGDLSTLKIDNVIKDAIVSNGVAPEHVRAVTLMLRDGVTMKDGEAYAADGGAFADSIPAFFTSDIAKHYVSAPNNSGAGASGSTSKASKWSKPPELSQMREWENDAVANPVEYNKLAQSWNRPDLEV